MTKGEFLRYFDGIPDDTEIVIADYVGEDIEIGDVVYFEQENLAWIRTVDLILDEEEEDKGDDIEEEGTTVEGVVLCLPNPDNEQPPEDVIKPRGKQRAA